MNSNKKSGIGKFVLGAAVGAGLGILFAPKKGSETREDLKICFQKLLDQVKSIDMEEVRKEFEKKIDELEKELSDLNKEKVIKIAKQKATEVKEKAEELVELAKEKGTPILENAAEEVRQQAIETTKKVLEKLENA